MPVRISFVDGAARAARRRLQSLEDDLRTARLAAGLSQRRVAGAIGVSKSQIAHIEAGRVHYASLLLLARYAAVVGLEVAIRAHPGGQPLRDTAQLALLERFMSLLPDPRNLRTEVPVAPGDRRAFDAVLVTDAGRVAIECISRLTDAQAQVRSILTKAHTAGIDRAVVVVAATRWNRAPYARLPPPCQAPFHWGRAPSWRRCA